MSGGEIVELFPGVEQTDADAPVRSKPRDPDAQWCAHRRLEMDCEARRVYCRDCTREVPAFDALDTFRSEWERYISARKAARRQARQAQQALDELRRQERNAKARLRRLRSQLPPPSLSPAEIDWLIRLVEANKPARVIVDGLNARLRAMRDEIEPTSKETLTNREYAERSARQMLGVDLETAYAMLDRGELDGTLAADELRTLAWLLRRERP